MMTDHTTTDGDSQMATATLTPTVGIDDCAPTDADQAEAAALFDEMDARGHLDHSERLTLAELVDRQSDFYRAWANPVGEMIARAMDRLAMQVRLTDATTPAEYEARADALEADVRESWEAAGYEAGRQAACRCGDVVTG